jgi:hypothetical protein
VSAADRGGNVESVEVMAQKSLAAIKQCRLLAAYLS